MNHAPDDRKRLRAQAEARIARDRRTSGPAQADSALLQELQVHQVELEMQNEELRRAHAALEVAHEAYVDLHEFSPVGYLTLDRKGQITRANLAGAALLGESRIRLQGHPFARMVGQESDDRWQRVFTSQTRTGPGTKGMVRLEVADLGVGIDPAILDRVFEPFFTTRPVGEDRGTGLGLAISHAIVTAHGGTLSVKSTPGKGSTFRMELPVAPREADAPSGVVDVP